MTPEPLPPAAGNAFQAFVQLVQWVDLTFGGGVERERRYAESILPTGMTCPLWIDARIAHLSSQGEERQMIDS
ncbi:hypothetical protein AFLA_000142 [Aspergillus flavus NRRL3357]|nr:hypothetical protein AFLA_000142 [Aspergillus flavus NRRL3357]